MNIKSFIEDLGDKQEALVKKGLQCKNTEELLALAKENGIALDEIRAAELFASMQLTLGKLTDDELDAVAGGEIDKANNYKCLDCSYQFYNPIVQHIPGGYYPQYGTCPRCNSNHITSI